MAKPSKSNDVFPPPEPWSEPLGPTVGPAGLLSVVGALLGFACGEPFDRLTHTVFVFLGAGVGYGISQLPWSTWLPQEQPAEPARAPATKTVPETVPETEVGTPAQPRETAGHGDTAQAEEEAPAEQAEGDGDDAQSEEGEPAQAEDDGETEQDGEAEQAKADPVI